MKINNLTLKMFIFIQKTFKSKQRLMLVFFHLILFNNPSFAYNCEQHPFDYVPPTAHFMISKSILNDSIEIEDGSIWKLNPYDEYKIANWFISDPLVISQNQRWLSNYQYRIFNKKRKVSIEVNLSQGPITNGPKTLYIEAIDLENGIVYLNNFTQWRFDWKDQQIFQNWRARDAVIIGENSDFFNAFEAILINIAENKSARIQQF